MTIQWNDARVREAAMRAMNEYDCENVYAFVAPHIPVSDVDNIDAAMMDWVLSIDGVGKVLAYELLLKIAVVLATAGSAL